MHRRHADRGHGYRPRGDVQHALGGTLALGPVRDERRQPPGLAAPVAAGQIPARDCGAEKAAAVEAEMEPALKAYRATKTAPKRGNVAFVPRIPPRT